MILINFAISSSSYSSDGFILLEDDRLTPDRIVEVYVVFRTPVAIIGSTDVYTPMDEYAEFIRASFEATPPVTQVAELFGLLQIIDPDQVLLGRTVAVAVLP